MGNILAKRSQKAVTVVNGDAYISNQTPTAKRRMEMILTHWLLNLNMQIEAFPIDIIRVIIDKYTHQEIFEEKINYKQLGKISNDNANYDYLLRLVIIGNHGAGKTSLMNRFVDDIFTETWNSTIGCDFKVKSINFQNKKIILQIWELEGGERFRKIFSSYYKGAHAILICYDISDEWSMKCINHWNHDIEKSKHHILLEKIIIGNKSDLQATRVCSKDDIVQIAKQCGIEHIFENSAKNAINTDKIFMDLAELLVNKIEHKLRYPFSG